MRRLGFDAAASTLVVTGFLAGSVGFSTEPNRLLFHAETRSGEVVVSNRADRAFNPASVIKVGTSWWALERLGPDHRFSTGFGFLGGIEGGSGHIRGALVVTGGGDPDFHMENAFLVARELNRLGVHTVDGDLVVTGQFWMGWENGAARPARSEVRRSLMMAGRLRDSLDPRRWKASEINAWNELCDRRGWDRRRRWAVEVRGETRVSESLSPRPLITHRSSPLRVVLRRFNVFSNNDMIRIADGLGGVAGLQSFLRAQLEVADSDLTLATASGQGSNRMTARTVVGMLRGFEDTVRKVGLGVDDLLAIPGCDPGPTRRMFPRLVSGPHERAVVGKTGTLTTTDGGVVAFAGTFLSHDRGEILFCVAAPGSGWEITRWRGVEEAWLIDLLVASGGAEARGCGPDIPYPDTMAEVSVHREVAYD